MKITKSKLQEQLKHVMRHMAEHTLPECQHTCAVPYSCCSPEYCQMAMEYALEEWGVQLQPTGHERLPLLGEHGCIAEPHLRPLCTLHTCQINGIGIKPGDQKWTDKYFELRQQANEITNELYLLKSNPSSH